MQNSVQQPAEPALNVVVDLGDGRRLVRLRDRDVVLRVVGDKVAYEKDDDYIFLQERKAAVERLLDGTTWVNRRKVLLGFYSAADLIPGMRVLDVGFRDYRNLEFIRETYAVDPWGVDIAHGAVALAVDRGFHVEKCDIQKKVPFQGEKFDRVLCIDVLEHLPDAVGGLDRMRVALTRNGRLVVQTIIEECYGENLIHGHCSLFHSVDRLKVLMWRASLRPVEQTRLGSEWRLVCLSVPKWVGLVWRVMPMRLAVRFVRLARCPNRSNPHSSEL